MILTAHIARLSLAAAIAAALPLSAHAMISDPDTPQGTAASSGSPGSAELLAKAQMAIDAGDYAGALAPLQQIVAAEPNNADAFNLYGYALRSLGRYQEALVQYDRALAIDPEHLGANEYLGELMLKVGNVAGAQERLAVLDEICYLGCNEYDALEAAIEAYLTAE